MVTDALLRSVRNMVLKKGEANMPKTCVVNMTQSKSVDKSSLREKNGILSQKRMEEMTEDMKLAVDISYRIAFEFMQCSPPLPRSEQERPLYAPHHDLAGHSPKAEALKA